MNVVINSFDVIVPFTAKLLPTVKSLDIFKLFAISAEPVTFKSLPIDIFLVILPST